MLMPFHRCAPKSSKGQALEEAFLVNFNGALRMTEDGLDLGTKDQVLPVRRTYTGLIP